MSDNTVAYNTALSDQQKIEDIQNSCGKDKDLTYTPFCFARIIKRWACKSPRMISKPYGFKCPECGNMLGFNSERLVESPLNKINPETYKYPYPND